MTMTLDSLIIARIAQLTEMGNRVLHRPQTTDSGGLLKNRVANEELAYQWAASSLSLIERVCGKDSVHYEHFVKHAEKIDEYRHATFAKGILNSFRDDYENGLLFTVRQLIRAEIFSDFLEQAVHLCSLGYYQPAAVVSGCVLEDAMRKLCVKHGVSVADKPKLDLMNSDLAKAGVYNMLTQKRVTALADLRNKAAHGKWTEFSRQDVDIMVRDISTLVQDWLK